jgi:hypothetical protein
MKIACLGWGSLVWDPRDLKIRSDWKPDGPLLPIEFARQSGDGRITLVICDTNKFSKVYWALMSNDNITDAIESLRAREGTSKTHIHHVSQFEKVDNSNEIKKIIHDWLIKNSLDSAIWTGLPPKFEGVERKPTCSEIIKYLKDLNSSSYDRAKEYIENTPIQIETEYKEKIGVELKWKFNKPSSA